MSLAGVSTWMNRVRMRWSNLIWSAMLLEKTASYSTSKFIFFFHHNNSIDLAISRLELVLLLWYVDMVECVCVCACVFVCRRGRDREELMSVWEDSDTWILLSTLRCNELLVCISVVYARDRRRQTTLRRRLTKWYSVTKNFEYIYESYERAMPP